VARFSRGQKLKLTGGLPGAGFIQMVELRPDRTRSFGAEDEDQAAAVGEQPGVEGQVVGSKRAGAAGCGAVPADRLESFQEAVALWDSQELVETGLIVFRKRESGAEQVLALQFAGGEDLDAVLRGSAIKHAADLKAAVGKRVKCFQRCEPDLFERFGLVANRHCACFHVQTSRLRSGYPQRRMAASEAAAQRTLPPEEACLGRRLLGRAPWGQKAGC